MRNDADYNLTRQWNRLDALNRVQAARRSFVAWAAIESLGKVHSIDGPQDIDSNRRNANAKNRTGFRKVIGCNVGNRRTKPGKCPPDSSSISEVRANENIEVFRGSWLSVFPDCVATNHETGGPLSV
jgi:hypothetical protein